MNYLLFNSVKFNSIKRVNSVALSSCVNKLIINQFHNSKLNLNINNNLKTKINNDTIKNFDILINQQQVTKHKKPGIVFDIDGVLVKGKTVLPETLKALKLLNTLRIPFMFLTNGGGKTEKKKAEELSRRFQVPIHEEQVVLGHSPMINVSEEIKNKVVLVIGPGT